MSTATKPLTYRDLAKLRGQTFDEFVGHSDPPVGEQGRPYWRASMLGRCLRYQFLWRSGVPPSRTQSAADDEKMHRRFAAGNEAEAAVIRVLREAGLLLAEQVEVADHDLSVTGHMDAIYGGLPQLELPPQSRWWTPEYTWAVRTLRERLTERMPEPLPVTGLEVKATGGWAVSQMRNEGGPRFDYRMQAAWYYDTGGPPGLPLVDFQILVVSFDPGVPGLQESVRGADVHEARKRCRQLKDAWDAQELPPCSCGLTAGLGWEATLCPYLGLDGSVCCGSDDQLERALEASIKEAERAKADRQEYDAYARTKVAEARETISMFGGDDARS